MKMKRGKGPDNTIIVWKWGTRPSRKKASEEHV